jgi:hypothetical protein
MKSLAMLAALILVTLCACSSSGRATPPATLHRHVESKPSQVTPLLASGAAVSNGIATALAAKSMQVLSTSGDLSWGRVAAVDPLGIHYVLTWELATASSGPPPRDGYALLLISCAPKQGTVSVGELAEAVRRAAESEVEGEGEGEG